MGLSRSLFIIRTSLTLTNLDSAPKTRPEIQAKIDLPAPYVYIAESLDMSSLRIDTPDPDPSPHRESTPMPAKPRYYAPAASRPEAEYISTNPPVTGPLPIPEEAAEALLGLRRNLRHTAQTTEADFEALRRLARANIEASLEVSRAHAAAATLMELQAADFDGSSQHMPQNGDEFLQSANVPPLSERDLAVAEMNEARHRADELEALLNDGLPDEHWDFIDAEHDKTQPFDWEKASRSPGKGSKTPSPDINRGHSWKKNDEANFTLGVPIKKEIVESIEFDEPMTEIPLLQRGPSLYDTSSSSDDDALENEEAMEDAPALATPLPDQDPRTYTDEQLIMFPGLANWNKSDDSPPRPMESESHFPSPEFVVNDSDEEPEDEEMEDEEMEGDTEEAEDETEESDDDTEETNDEMDEDEQNSQDGETAEEEGHEGDDEDSSDNDAQGYDTYHNLGANAGWHLPIPRAPPSSSSSDSDEDSDAKEASAEKIRADQYETDCRRRLLKIDSWNDEIPNERIEKSGDPRLNPWLPLQGVNELWATHTTGMEDLSDGSSRKTWSADDEMEDVVEEKTKEEVDEEAGEQVEDKVKIKEEPEEEL